MFHHNENMSMKDLLDWNTEEHGDHVTVQLKSFIRAAPEYCDNHTLIKICDN